MERQTIIDNIESISRSLENIIAFNTIITEFIDKPKDKDQIRNFCEKYVLDTFMSAGELKVFYAKLTIESSYINCYYLKDIIRNNTTVTGTKLIDGFKFRIKNTINAILDFIVVTNKEIMETGFPDLSERLMAIRRATFKINTLFICSRQLPVNIDQFPQLELVDEDDNLSLTKDLTQIIDIVKKRLNYSFEDIANYSILSIYEGSVTDATPLLCKNNWVSLRNFIMYLDSFKTY